MDISSSPEKVRVFWQPGCSSCLRTKEFLTQQGVEFESIDVHNDPNGMAQLLELGVRSVPVVAVGKRYTFCQTMSDVVTFLDLKIKLNDALPPEQLMAKLDHVLTCAVRYLRQLTEAQAGQFFRDRKRTAAQLAFHVFAVAEMGMKAGQGIEFRSEGYSAAPSPEWKKEDIARWGEAVRESVRAWWQGESDKTLKYTVKTYFGERAMHEVFERTAWHAAQHTRQIMLMLESYETAPIEPLTAADLAGLPLPDEIWDIPEHATPAH